MNIETPYEKLKKERDSAIDINEIDNITNISNFMDNLVIEP
jgi:hypothetical protein